MDHPNQHAGEDGQGYGHAVRAARVYHHVQGGPGDVQGHGHHCVVPME